MNTALVLYALVVLANLKAVAEFFALIGILSVVILGFVWADNWVYGKKTNILKKLTKWAACFYAVCISLIILIPDKDQLIFIVAGTGVVEAAKSDTARRLANESVVIIEQWLKSHTEAKK